MSQRLLLLGLEEETASLLAAVIPTDQFEVHIVPRASTQECLSKLDVLRPSVICLPAEPEASAPLIHAIRTRMARAPVVLVSRNPNPAEWKLAMEGGASDYFGPPFLPGQVDWILKSAAGSAPMGAYLSSRG